MFRRAIGLMILFFLVPSGALAEDVFSTLRHVTISTTPSWASMRIVGDPTIYFTPTVIALESDGVRALRIEKEGYEPVFLKVHRLGTLKMAKGGIDPAKPDWFVEALSDLQYRTVGSMLMISLRSTTPPEPPAPAPSELEKPPRDDVSQKLKELYRLRKQGKISASRYKVEKKKILQEAETSGKQEIPNGTGQ